MLTFLLAPLKPAALQHLKELKLEVISNHFLGIQGAKP
jgi:hypothetical protein